MANTIHAKKTAPDGYKNTHAGVLPNEWILRPLSEIVEVITETTGERKIETVSISAGIGFVNQAEKFGKELSGKQYEKYTVLHQGDFSYNKGNSNLYPQGCIYRLHDRSEAAVPNVFESFRITEGDPDYYEQLFISGFLNKQLYSKINRGVRDDGLLNLRSMDFYNCEVSCPPLAEQERIAEILKQCDAVIELYRKKVTELNKLKKVCMTKMFPQKDQDNPIIRFKDYSDKWKEYIFGEIYKERNDPGHSGLPILTVSIHSGVSDGELDKEELGKKVKRSEDKTLYKQVCCGDLVLNMMRAWQGAIGVAKCEGMVSPAYITAIPNEYVYPPFMEYCLRTPEIMYQINTLSYGVTDFRKRIYWDSFVRIKCKLPSIEEQKAIADYFMNIDHLIDLYQQNLEQMKKTKTALMQLLFTGIVRVNV